MAVVIRTGVLGVTIAAAVSGRRLRFGLRSGGCRRLRPGYGDVPAHSTPSPVPLVSSLSISRGGDKTESGGAFGNLQRADDGLSGGGASN